MTSKLSKTISSARTEDESLFSGILIRWSALNTAERLICGLVVLMPVWWVLGILRYILVFTTVGIALYEWRRYGKLHLKRPSLLVVALLLFYTYNFAYGFLAQHFLPLSTDDGIQAIDLVETAFGFAFPCLVWYVQSNNVRVRLEVVAWACSISVAQMLAIWFVAHFIFSEPYYEPPRTLWGVLSGKSTAYERGIGQPNYLILYWPTDIAIAGLPRFYSFFYYPEYFGLFVGVVNILALDLKNRLWSQLLFCSSAFLIGLSGTRSVWIAFPLVLLIRFLLTTGKVGGTRLLFTLIAIMSFVTFSVPPVTNLVLNTYTNTATSISKFRANSTNDRAQVYEGTLNRILDNPVNFVFGYASDGPEVLGAGINIGSHSFILGSLLYKGGLVGTGLFMSFWASLIMWLYRTRIDRPVCCFLILLLLSITFATMLLSFIAPLAILVSMMLRRPAIKSVRNAT